jgi:excinuclease ABC subunit C
MHFGTARAVRNASRDDLRRAPGISVAMADSVYDFFHG